MPEQNSTLTTEYRGETMEKESGVFKLVTIEERIKVLGNLEKYISTEGMGCVVCPCYTSCGRC